jgi:hypothetical protein
VIRRTRHIRPAGSLSNPESYAIGFHDPKLTCRCPVSQDQSDPMHESEDGVLVLPLRTKNNDPGVLSRRYARMLAKSRSSVTRTRPSARDLTAIAESSAPVRRSSATVSASNPPSCRNPAHSLGKFSSSFSLEPYIPKEGPPFPLARVRQRRPERPECPVPEWKGSCR